MNRRGPGALHHALAWSIGHGAWSRKPGPLSQSKDPAMRGAELNGFAGKDCELF
jgi:hypothetical protein